MVINTNIIILLVCNAYTKLLYIIIIKLKVLYIVKSLHCVIRISLVLSWPRQPRPPEPINSRETTSEYRLNKNSLDLRFLFFVLSTDCVCWYTIIHVYLSSLEPIKIFYASDVFIMFIKMFQYVVALICSVQLHQTLFRKESTGRLISFLSLQTFYKSTCVLDIVSIAFIPCSNRNCELKLQISHT